MLNLALGHIYVLVQREFVKSGEKVVKIGRTSNVIKRFKEYPKGSVLLFSMFCNNCVKTEAELIKLMNVKFKNRKDIGKESFEGDLREICLFVSNYVGLKEMSGVDIDIAAIACGLQVKSTEGVEVKSEGRFKDILDVVEVVKTSKEDVMCSDTAIVRFVEDHKRTLNNSKVLSAQLYGKFLSWADKKFTDKKVSIKHFTFTKILSQIYNAKSVVAKDGLEVVRYIQMPQLVEEDENGKVEGMVPIVSLMSRALVFIDAKINFNPARTRVSRAWKYYAWISMKESFVVYWNWFTDRANAKNYALIKTLEGFQLHKRRMKCVLRQALSIRGRQEIRIKPVTMDSGIKVINNVQWKN